MTIRPISMYKFDEQKKKKYGVLRGKYEDRIPLYNKALSYLLKKIAKIRTDADRSTRLRLAYTTGRVKSVHSIIRKAVQRNITAESALNVIEDVIGVRIVVNNIKDVKTLIDELRKIDGLTINRVKSHAEINGYRARHLNVTLRLASKNGKKQTVAVEIQIRTLLQDAWAILSHRDVYKNKAHLPELAKTLSASMSRMLASLDKTANDFRRKISAKVKPPNDLSEKADLDHEGIAFLYYEIFGETADEFEVEYLSDYAKQYGVGSVGEARGGLTKDVFDKLATIRDKRFPGESVSNIELFKYGLLYVQNGTSAFKEYKLKVDEDWEILETYDDEVLSELPDTFEEFIEKLKSGSIPMMALKVLGGIEGCYRCAEDILIPSTAAEAILNFYENPDTSVDLANLIYSTAVNLGHEVESFDSDGLCTHCSYSASKDD